MVGKEVGSGVGIAIGSALSGAGVDMVIRFCMTNRTGGTAYSGGGGGEKGSWCKL